MRPETFAAMAASPTMCEHLHYPLQSGSDAVLAAMHRGYTADRYLERLAQARTLMPDLAVSTDIIVGFPGETEEDFARTMALVEDVGRKILPGQTLTLDEAGQEALLEPTIRRLPVRPETYAKAPAVTRDRMYLETMQQIYGNVTKVLVESRQGSNLLYLPLDKIMQGVSGNVPAADSSAAPSTQAPAPAAIPGLSNDARSRDSSRSRDREAR